ncbi:hypothetical protein [Brachyspira hyodysenteriae]|uniref:Uncharacterized protein n=1 Tax=Brachyspira hyodysenteriae (strain ATCC 49526 / WA1) TaxID=565034 RepID=A0A3B6VGW5_BRAHW|nr:hypothetical protein [Brachyspira hyodysenteriae]ACN83216.1 hypothetical protein BHWA1_00722 [Brachyspira hyodysenteriae WA1]MCZ9924162.1 hypothetical protein [Brachyspira hyodysenteriae]
MKSKNNVSRESFTFKQNENVKKQVSNIISNFNNVNKNQNSNTKKDK